MQHDGQYTHKADSALLLTAFELLFPYNVDLQVALEVSLLGTFVVAIL